MLPLSFAVLLHISASVRCPTYRNCFFGAAAADVGSRSPAPLPSERQERRLAKSGSNVAKSTPRAVALRADQPRCPACDQCKGLHVGLFKFVTLACN